MTKSAAATLEERVGQIETTPSIPTIFLPLLNLLNLPPERVKLDEVVKLVSYDNTIAAQCLRVASSPLFGLAKSPDSIRAAVISLGLRRVETILLTCCLGNAFPTENWPLDPTTFWKHSLGCAMVCRKFSEKLATGDSDKAYMAGLLHDIGFMVNCIAFPKEFVRRPGSGHRLSPFSQGKSGAPALGCAGALKRSVMPHARNGIWILRAPESGPYERSRLGHSFGGTQKPCRYGYGSVFVSNGRGSRGSFRTRCNHFRGCKS